MSEIQFLNIDLDLESNEDLTSIIESFRSSATVMRDDHIEGKYYASFEIGFTEENKIIQEYILLIKALDSNARLIWDQCISRVFNFGYDSGEKPNNYISNLSKDSITLLAEVGGSIAITIYPASRNDT